jgi:hypothetical protein
MGNTISTTRVSRIKKQQMTHMHTQIAHAQFYTDRVKGQTGKLKGFREQRR